MAHGFYVEATAFLPDDRLRELARCEDLRDIASLHFTVDTSENSLGDLGHRLPALTHLRLDGSNIATLRDLGTGLGGLRVLWLARSGLRELEGFGSLSALRELFLAFNDVEDLSPLMGAEDLQVLDLEGNAVADPEQMHYLMGCDELVALTLEGNPVAEAADYRTQVLQALPQLRVLDDEATTDGNALGATDGAEGLGAPGAFGVDSDGVHTVVNVSSGGFSSSASSSSASGGNADCGSESGCRPGRPAGKGFSGVQSSAVAAAARFQEYRLVRDGIKYTDALRAYDVASHEALGMVRRVHAPSPSILYRRTREACPHQRSPYPATGLGLHRLSH